MNEQLQQALVQFLEKIIAGVDMTADRLPAVLDQLLRYGMISSLAAQVGGIVLILLSFYVTHCFGKWYKKSVAEKRPWLYFEGKVGSSTPSILHDFVWILRYAIPGFMILLGVMTIATNFTWVKIWISPDVYLLEYIRGML